MKRRYIQIEVGKPTAEGITELVSQGRHESVRTAIEGFLRESKVLRPSEAAEVTLVSSPELIGGVSTVRRSRRS